MTEQEEAFIQGIELAKDYRLDGPTKEDFERYEQLIKKRKNEATTAQVTGLLVP